jgi:hypothetical protein
MVLRPGLTTSSQYSAHTGPDPPSERLVAVIIVPTFTHTRSIVAKVSENNISSCWRSEKGKWSPKPQLVSDWRSTTLPRLYASVRLGSGTANRYASQHCVLHLCGRLLFLIACAGALECSLPVKTIQTNGATHTVPWNWATELARITTCDLIAHHLDGLLVAGRHSDTWQRKELVKSGTYLYTKEQFGSQLRIHIWFRRDGHRAEMSDSGSSPMGIQETLSSWDNCMSRAFW